MTSKKRQFVLSEKTKKERKQPKKKFFVASSVFCPKYQNLKMNRTRCRETTANELFNPGLAMFHVATMDGTNSKKEKNEVCYCFVLAILKVWYTKRVTDICSSSKKTTLIPIPLFWYFRRSKWYQYSNKKGKWYWYLGRRYSERLFEQHSSVKTKKVTLNAFKKLISVHFLEALHVTPESLEWISV